MKNYKFDNFNGTFAIFQNVLKFDRNFREDLGKNLKYSVNMHLWGSGAEPGS